MHFIVNTNRNASTNNNGIEFEPRDGAMVSVAPVDGETLALFLAVPGFSVLELPVPAAAPEVLLPQLAAEPAPLGVTGTMTESGPYNINIPMPDGSVLNMQGEHPTDPNPVLQADGGAAAQLVEKFADGANDGPGDGITGDPSGETSAQEQPPAEQAEQAEQAAAPHKRGRKPAAAKE